jgi:O-antigen ligase
MSTSSPLALALERPVATGADALAFLLKCVYAALNAPEYIFIAALTAMLLRPPDLHSLPWDRIAFVLLVGVVLLRICLWRERILLHSASCPLVALLALGLWGVLSQKYNADAWSVLAAKWIVPVTMFHIAPLIFPTGASLRKLEWFSVAVLLYLSLAAVASLLEMKSLVFPRFILDESIGIHADRARGPFLQAVANGVCINVLGVVALHCWERQRLRGIIASALFVATPVALLATKTRAVWAGAGVSVAMLLFFARGRSRLVALAISLCVIAATSLAFLLQTADRNFGERFHDRSPVEFRLEMYRAGWQMFIEKPVLGWGNEASIQPEIEKRVSGFHPDYYIFHNTYLELAVEHGVLGLALYAWVFLAFFRIRAKDEGSGASGSAFGEGFGLMWRISLCAYLLNASIAVMNYQFVNAYVFTIAGILAAQARRVPIGGRDANCLPF